jgi:CubicO group peptidase (beta-lactamase class C family)
MKRFAPILVILAGSGAALWADEADDRSRGEQVDRIFAAWNKPDSPGVAVGVMREGTAVFARGYGTANLDDRVPITPKTVFELGSATKSFTCVCMALLLDQGRIAPDDDVRKYLPELPVHDPPIRVRHLIRCECGLWEYFHLMQLAGWNIDDAYTEGDVWALLARQKPQFPPGARFAYTSSGYFLMGLMVRRVTGQSLAEFARKNVFEPLGMTATYFDDHPTTVVPHRAVGYNVSHDGAIRRWMMNSSTVGGWGLKSSVEDLARWDRNFYANKLPAGKHLKEFLTRGTLLDNRNVLNAQPVERYRGLRRMQFTGGMPGFGAAIVRFPDERLSVVVLTNDNWRVVPWDMAAQVAELFVGDRMEKPVEKPPEAAPSDAKFVALSDDQLRDKAGDYEINSGRIWKLAPRDGGLAVTDHLGATYGWRAVDPRRFRPVEGPLKATIVFDTNQKGGDTPTVRMVADRGHVSNLRRVQLAHPNAAELGAYEGAYYNDELQTTYRFSRRDEALWMQVNNRRLERLDATVADTFIPHVRTVDDGRIVRFRRDENKAVVGLTIDLGRVDGLKFDRLANAGATRQRP